MSHRDVRISLVILTHNSATHIDACLGSLLHNGPGSELDEVLVVDNGSTDGTAAILNTYIDRHGPQMSVLWQSENIGTTRSRNLALRKARGQYIGVIDSDTVTPPNTLNSLLGILEKDETIGIVSPELVFPDGRVQLSADVFPTIPRKIQRYFRLRTLEANASARPTEDLIPVDYAISAFWIMGRGTVGRVGLFDENIFYAPEDADYCFRVWTGGLRVVQAKSVRAVHDARELSRSGRLNRASIEHIRGLVYFFRKHRYCLSLKRVYPRMPLRHKPGQ